MREQGWNWVEEYIWHKKNTHPGKWPNRLRDLWEHIYHFTKSKKFKMFQNEVKVPIGDWAEKRLSNLGKNDKIRFQSRTNSGFGKNIANWVGKDTVLPGNVLHMATESSNKNHSATFPVDLPLWFIKLLSEKNDIILDPFMGSGTTAVASIRLERHYLGIEINPEFCQVAEERISKENRDYQLELDKFVEMPKDMNTLDMEEVSEYLKRQVAIFQQKRIDFLKRQTLHDLLKNKNPYLSKAKDIATANDLVVAMLDASLYSSEETTFGNFLEDLALFVSKITLGAHKSAARGVDIEYVSNGIHHLISVKSGKNWGNSSQLHF